MFDSWITWYGIPLVICLVSAVLVHVLGRWSGQGRLAFLPGVIVGLGSIPFLNILVSVVCIVIAAALGGVFVVTNLIRVLEKR